MDIKINGKKDTTQPTNPKLYTQSQVDTLLEDRKTGFPDKISAENQATQNAVKLKILSDETVNKLVRRSNSILASIRSHALPFDLFPDTLNVEEGRITIIYRHFLNSEIHSVDIKDISNIFINRTFLFAQLVIVSKTFEDNEVRIRSLIPRQAIYIRRLIEGLRVFINNNIDTSAYTSTELIKKLEGLSSTKIVT